MAKDVNYDLVGAGLLLEVRNVQDLRGRIDGIGHRLVLAEAVGLGWRGEDLLEIRVRVAQVN